VSEARGSGEYVEDDEGHLGVWQRERRRSSGIEMDVV
jgi:hypothetical protein